MHSASGVGDEGRVDLSGGLVMAKLPLRLEAILHGMSFEVALLLVKFIGSLRDLRPHIGTLRSHAAVGSKTRYASSFTRSFTRNHANA